MEHVVHEHDGGRVVIGDEEAVHPSCDNTARWNVEEYCLWCGTLLNENDVSARIQHASREAVNRFCVSHATKAFNALDDHDTNQITIHPIMPNTVESPHGFEYAVYGKIHGERCIYCDQTAQTSGYLLSPSALIPLHERCASALATTYTDTLYDAIETDTDTLFTQLL